MVVLYTLHLISSAAALSIPVPRIVLRLRAPSSCPDPFSESLDEDVTLIGLQPAFHLHGPCHLAASGLRPVGLSAAGPGSALA
jgi:hypothetical protein